MNGPPEPMERLVFDTQRLMVEHPPVWRHRNKQAVYEIACPSGCVHRGRIQYSRWPAMGPPERVDIQAASSLVESRQDVYDYAPAINAVGAVEWHVNFADPHLFAAYGSSLLAQDERQVAEHPALGAVREALAAGGHTAKTVENGRPTPVLVMDVERRCRIATDRNADEGRPGGLYGNAFARAAAAAVQRATSRIDPPTRSNVIAMAAPPGGRGQYDQETIEHILVTAFSGFQAAALEAARVRRSPTPVAVHTGFWGCGAFGGNRVLMATLQLLAAQMAALDRLVFHTFDRSGTTSLAEARKVVDEKLGGLSPMEMREAIERVFAMGYEWGVSDGN